jgi:hypothetical protein
MHKSFSTLRKKQAGILLLSESNDFLEEMSRQGELLHWMRRQPMEVAERAPRAPVSHLQGLP